MATLKVFISSTSYDLGVVRSKLQEFLRSLGYEPILSEYSDVLYDPRSHTHTSCVAEVANCEIMILLVGARFGGKAVPESTLAVNLDKAKGLSASTWILENGQSLSITQLESLKAIECNMPVFVFVDDKVMHDHLVYERNKNKTFLSELHFPSIEKQDSAKYIFEFINFLRHRTIGNAIHTFTRIDDIEVHLRKQWSALFQRLLSEQRSTSLQTEQARDVATQLEDLKAALLSSIQAPGARDIARGVIRYRMLVEFLSQLSPADQISSAEGESTWLQVMNQCKISSIAQVVPKGSTKRSYDRERVFLLRNDGTYVILRDPWNLDTLKSRQAELTPFMRQSLDVRRAVTEAWSEQGRMVRPIVSPGKGQFDQHVASLNGPHTLELYDAELKGLTGTSEVGTQGPGVLSALAADDDDDIPF